MLHSICVSSIQLQYHPWDTVVSKLQLSFSAALFTVQHTSPLDIGAHTHDHYLYYIPPSRYELFQRQRSLAQHLVQAQRAQHICPSLSHGLHSEVNYGPPKGSVWLGDIWLSLVLRNPQPSPSAWRPRCAEPASLQLIPTPLVLCHSWVFNLATVPSLVPITRHTHVQLSCIINFTEEVRITTASTVNVGGKT